APRKTWCGARWAGGSLAGTGREAAVDEALQRQKDDQGGHDHQDRAGGDRLPLGAERALEAEQGGGNGAEFGIGHVEEGHVEVVVDGDALDDDDGGDGRPQHRKNDLPVDRPGVGAVDARGLVHGDGNRPDELQEDVDGDDVGTAVEKDGCPAGVEGAQIVNHLEGGDLRGHAGHQRGQQEEARHQLPQTKPETVDGVGGHRADQYGPGGGHHEDQRRVAERPQHRALLEGGRVVREVEPVAGQRQRAVVHDLRPRFQRGQHDDAERHQDHGRRQQQGQVLQGDGGPGQPTAVAARTGGNSGAGGHESSTLSSGISRRWTQVISRMRTSRTTADAEAKPTLSNWKASLTVWMTKVSVPLAPPVMMYGISNTAREPDTARMKLRLMTGLMLGAMMCRNCCQRFAPSSCAASYRCGGIDWMAPRNRTMFSPMKRHTDTPASEGLARSGSPSHRCLPSTPIRRSSVSRVPSGWKKYRNTNPTATPLIR